MVFEHYKRLHRSPELSQQEHRTACFIEYALQGWGYETKRVGVTGVIADLVVDEQLPWLLFRADIDALPIQEKSGVDYVSQHEGVMHACGHDAHTAMLLEAARLLQGTKLPQNIRFLFQPAEENSMGAELVLKENVLPENLQASFAMHVWPGVPKGALATCTGALMASCDFFKVIFHGKSVHCAQAHLGNDALQSAVQLVSRLGVIKSLETEKIILFCGSIHSGNGFNIVPDEASVGGTLRTFSVSVKNRLQKKIQEAAEAAAQEFGAYAEVQWLGGTPPLANDQALIDELAGFLPNIYTDVEPSYAAEDFARYQEYAPGVLMWLGTGDTAPLHNECFLVPEEVLYVGVDGWLKIARHTFADGGVEE